MARPAMTHWLGNRTGGGQTGMAIQMDVHQGQCARYDIFDDSPHRFTTQRRYPMVSWSSTNSRVNRATARVAITTERSTMVITLRSVLLQEVEVHVYGNDPYFRVGYKSWPRS